MAPNTPAMGAERTAADLRRLRRAPGRGSLCLCLQCEASGVFVRVFVCVFVRLFVCVFVWLFVSLCLFVSLVAWLAVCVYVCLFVFCYFAAQFRA